MATYYHGSGKWIKRARGLGWVLLPLLMAFSIVTAACEDVPGLPTASPSPPAPKAESRRTLVLSEDRALLAVQEYLLLKATSARAKTYLTELYAAGGKWSGKGELLKDGTRVWNVMLETEDKADNQIKPCWRQASWTVFDDGKVLPTTKYGANALRIETDLQQLGGGS